MPDGADAPEGKLVKVVTVPQCRVCSSELRDAIDALLYRRERREVDTSTGRVLTFDSVRKLIPVIDPSLSPAPSKPALTRHFGKHTTVELPEVPVAAAAVVGEDGELDESVVRELAEAILRGEGDDTSGLRLVVAAHAEDLARRIVAGQPVKITNDTATRAAQALAARSEKDSTAFLMATLGAGIERVFTRQVAAPQEPKQLDATGDVIEHEAVEVTDADS